MSGNGFGLGLGFGIGLRLRILVGNKLRRRRKREICCIGNKLRRRRIKREICCIGNKLFFQSCNDVHMIRMGRYGDCFSHFLVYLGDWIHFLV